MDDQLKLQTQFRLVLGKEAIEALDASIASVNDGFAAGKVDRAELATYLFLNASRFLGKSELARIRNEFFDEDTALKNLVEESRAKGRIPDELRKLLRDKYRGRDEDRK